MSLSHYSLTFHVHNPNRIKFSVNNIGYVVLVFKPNFHENKNKNYYTTYYKNYNIIFNFIFVKFNKNYPFTSYKINFFDKILCTSGYWFYWKISIKFFQYFFAHFVNNNKNCFSTFYTVWPVAYPMQLITHAHTHVRLSWLTNEQF